VTSLTLLALTRHVCWPHAVLETIGSIAPLLHNHHTASGQRNAEGTICVSEAVVSVGRVQSVSLGHDEADCSQQEHNGSSSIRPAAVAAQDKALQGCLAPHTPVQLSAKAETAVGEESQGEDGLGEALCIIHVALEQRSGGWGELDGMKNSWLRKGDSKWRAFPWCLLVLTAAAPQLSLPQSPPVCPLTHRDTC
jgi:hypothetical protein